MEKENNNNDSEMTSQDKTRLLMTTIGLPWWEITKLSDEDTEFLLGKAKDIERQQKEYHQRQQQQQLQEQQRQQQQQGQVITPGPDTASPEQHYSNIQVQSAPPPPQQQAAEPRPVASQPELLWL